MVRHTKKRYSKKRNGMKKMRKGGKKHNSYKKKKTTKRRVKKSKRKMTRRKKGGMDAYQTPPPLRRNNAVMPPYHPMVTRSQTQQKDAKKGGSSHVTTFVGAPYGPELKQLPGVSGPHDGNYYALNKYDVQPGRVVSGGRKYKKNKSKKLKQKGGLLGLNVFSEIQSDVVNGYRAITGQPPNPSPLPYKDQVFYGDRAQDNLNYLKVRIH
tara:strand:+ start:282 stop:911 length:630 start_codon:yes stop_codon:yes gene_type:complete